MSTPPTATRSNRFRRAGRTAAAVLAGASLLVAGLAVDRAQADPDGPVLDKYGQKTSLDWAGKVTSDAQLRADVAADRRYLQSINPPKRDAWGGDLGSKTRLGLERTGWFHIAQREGKSVLVDPSGNQFFSLGINGVGGTSDTHTHVKGREEQYAWLPDKSDNGPFAAGWRSTAREDYSFYVANQVRKFGVAFDRSAWYDRQLSRIKAWGFNTAGGFSSKPEGAERFPYVQLLDKSPSARVGTSGIPDIYADGYADQLRTNFKAEIAQYKSDRYLIGYMFFNEINWAQLRTAITKADGTTVASKRVLVDQLEAKYTTIEAFNTAWKQTAASWDALLPLSFVPTTDAAVADVDAFSTSYLDDFYELYATTIRANDPNHLILGDRWLANVVNDDKLRGQLATASGKYLDALAYNYYSWDLSLDRISDIYTKSGGKPVIVTEFHYGEPTRGLTFAIRMAKNEKEKGRLYRSYVEKAAASGMVIGTHWFLYLDQAGTGRWFQGFTGEAGGIGFVDVADRPYKKMLTSVMEANYSIYNVLERKRVPFEYPYSPAQTDRVGNRTTDIPKAESAPAIDGELDATWPAGPTLSLGPADLVLGVSEDGVDGAFRLAWDDENLYVHGDINDPTPMQNAYNGTSTIWNGDALELFIGPENVDQGGSIQLRDSQLVISGKPDADGKPTAYWYNNRGAQAPVNAKIIASEGGYQLEAAIPLAELGLDGAAPPRALRFDLGFDDGSGTSRQRQYLWNGVDGNAANRDKWGRASLVLEAEEGGGAEHPPTSAQILTTTAPVDGQIVVTGAGKPGARYRAWIDGKPLGTMTVYDTGQVRYPFDLPAGLATGRHTVTVTSGSALLDSGSVRLTRKLPY